MVPIATPVRFVSMDTTTLMIRTAIITTTTIKIITITANISNNLVLPPIVANAAAIDQLNKGEV
uniref:Uncharacterized protein n=1 Tax=Romanomermis culicivorax TaxID=13658 RepID=A0A915KGG1_ROMCU